MLRIQREEGRRKAPTKTPNGNPSGAVAAGLPGAKLGPDKNKPAERGKRG